MNSRFTAGVFRRHMRSIAVTPRVVYPGINLDASTPPVVSRDDPDMVQALSYVSFLMLFARLDLNGSSVTAQRCSH